MPFSYTSGNPDNLTGGTPARMQDIQGPFYDIRSWLNSSTGGGAAAGGFIDAGAGPGAPVLDVGLLGQLRAGRQLLPADFTAMGLSVPLGLWNLGDLTDASGNGRALLNKGAAPFGVGVNGLSSTAAVFAGSTAQALYIADTGAADPFRIKTGSWGCWTRTAKIAAATQDMIGKRGAASQFGWTLYINATTMTAGAWVTGDGATPQIVNSVSALNDDRWHFVVATCDGALLRMYIDGVLDGVASITGPIFPAAAPLNIGASAADGSTAATQPHYGRVDEAFVTADVLTDDQVRNLYCAKIAHTLGVAPTRVKLNVRRQRRGTALATTDFPATPLRLHNFTAGALTDQGTGGVALTNSAPTLIVPVAGADGSLGNAFHFQGAHTGLTATDAGLPAGTASRSYGCWFKTSYVQVGAIMAWGTSTHLRLLTFGSGGNGILRADSQGDNLNVSSGTVADGLWHHVVIVEDNAAGDGVRRKAYLDGRLTSGSTALNAITLAGANRFRVGADADGSSPWQQGQVDGAFVYAGALTTEQVMALYAKGTQALTPSPKEAGAHVEAMDASNVLATFDTLDSQHQIDLGVAA